MNEQLAKRALEHTLDSILSRSYEQYEEFEQPEGLDFYGDELVNLPLFDEEDILILMHRDVHFSGSFSAMKEYYSNPEAKGAFEEIDLERISLLDSIQTRMKCDLAPLLITGPNAERVALARKTYANLQEVAKEIASPEGALAAAILSEEETDSLLESQSKVLAKRPESLLLLAASELFSDPLFPGYGTAPILAIKLLGQMKYEPAIPELFTLIGRSDFETENATLAALKQIGARQFALSVLASRPVTADHERAALVLLEFLPDAEIEAFFASLIRDPEISGTRLEEFLENVCCK